MADESFFSTSIVYFDTTSIRTRYNPDHERKIILGLSDTSVHLRYEEAEKIVEELQAVMQQFQNGELEAMNNVTDA